MIVLKHNCHPLRDGGWASGFRLDLQTGASLTSTRFFDPRTELRFPTEEAAKERNRTLARNWALANGVDVYEERSQ